MAEDNKGKPFGEGLWEIWSPEVLGLRGSALCVRFVAYSPGAYHVHRHNGRAKEETCFGYCDSLADAKVLTQKVYNELTEMGVVP